MYGLGDNNDGLSFAYQHHLTGRNSNLFTTIIYDQLPAKLMAVPLA